MDFRRGFVGVSPAIGQALKNMMMPLDPRPLLSAPSDQLSPAIPLTEAASFNATVPTWAPAAAVSADGFPPDGGVYLVFGDNVANDLFGASTAERSVLYVGSSKNLRDRVQKHLSGPTAQSSLRVSLGLRLRQALGLRLTAGIRGWHIQFDPEMHLSAWIALHLRFAAIPCRDHLSVEKALISLLAPTLNINELRDTAAAQQLLQERRVATGRTPYNRARKPSDD